MTTNDYMSGTQVSTRIRLARNLDGYPFPSHLTDPKQARDIIRRVSSSLNRVDEFQLYYMNGIDGDVANSLVENHLISPALVRNSHAAALINREESVSIMINEEDHLREQCIVKGADLKLAYDTMSEIDNKIGKFIKFAFDEELGYLTACPTNLGTGLRASVMLFLPMLTLSGRMPKVIRNISRLGLTVRGVYGEGSVAEGYMYQISNEVTLGLEEETIISEVEKAVLEVVGLEARAREELVKKDLIGVKDECRRSFGILTNCEKVSFKEFLQLVSNVKLGAALGYVNIRDISKLDDLIVAVRPANINLYSDREVSETEQDVCRAAKCFSALSKAVEQ